MSRRPTPTGAVPKEQNRLAFVLEVGSLKAAAKSQSAIGMMPKDSAPKPRTGPHTGLITGGELQAQHSWPEAHDTINANPELKRWVDATQTSTSSLLWRITRIPQSDKDANKAFYIYHRNNNIKVESFSNPDYVYYLFPVDKYAARVCSEYSW